MCDGIENNTSYDNVKDAILSSYSISTEGYRQACRNLSKITYHTYTEFASEKLRAFQRWLKSAEIDTFDKLVNLIVLEEFLRKVPYLIMTHIIDREEADLLKAAKIADVFSLVHRPMQGEKRKPFINVKSDAGPVRQSGAQTFGQGQTGTITNQVVCRFCKKTGHVIQDCRDPRCRVEKARGTTFT